MKTAGYTLTVNPKSPESCWVALDFENKIISEDIDPLVVDREAKKITKDYILSFVPKAGVTHIY